jgi:hypothetical protein
MVAMAKNHGAKDQKRLAKQKAKRLAKRSEIRKRDSKDPAVRLQSTAKWPVVEALCGDRLWEDGIGTLLIARRDPTGGLVFAVFLVDVFCLGVKNAFWRPGTPSDIEDVLKHIGQAETMRAVTPACLVKAIKGAVEYARSWGFLPHPEYGHASMLLDGIDPSSCPTKLQYGYKGRPFYVQGPNESPAEAAAIMQRVQNAKGHFMLSLRTDDDDESMEISDESDRLALLDEEGDPEA